MGDRWAASRPLDPTPFGTADKSHIPQGTATTVASPLPTDKQARKDTPLCTGVLDYFGAALAEVARVSKAGNDQHNPGQPLHWAWGKSNDHADCITRHLMERGTIDDDGMRHSAKMAWRALALLTEELVAEGMPLPRAARVDDGKVPFLPGPRPGRVEKVPPPVQDFLKHAIPCATAGGAVGAPIVGVVAY